MKKRGEILTENIIFIALNLIFLTILIVFLMTRMGSAAVLEEKYSKQIALIIDSAKPVMEIKLNMEDAIKKAESSKWNVRDIVDIDKNKNIVTVKLREDGQGYSYSFFNDMDVDVYPETDSSNKFTGMYVLIINEK